MSEGKPGTIRKPGIQEAGEEFDLFCREGFSPGFLDF